MLSYSYRPRAMSSPAAPPHPPPTQPQQPVHLSDDDRILQTVREDSVTLDYLVGVASRGKEYSFVQYRPTEKHKRCAGLKINPVLQINMFVQTLRDWTIPIETALHTTRIPSTKKSFWVRVSLADLTELSLEPLWMIKGRVQLYSKQRWVLVTIEDSSLESCILDTQSQLLSSQPEGHWPVEFLESTKEGLTGYKDRTADRDPDVVVDESQSDDSEPEEHNVDGARVAQKHTTTEVGLRHAAAKRRKSQVGGTGLGSVFLGKGGKEGGCDTPNVYTNFNRGTQTGMKSRQRLKRVTNTLYNKMYRHKHCETPNGVSLNPEDRRGRSPPSSSPPIPGVHVLQAPVAPEITPHVAAAPSPTEPQHLDESTGTDAVERLAEPVSEAEISARCPSPRQPPEPRVPQRDTTEGPTRRGCSLM